MPRGRGKPSQTALSVLAEAEKNVWTAWVDATNFTHRGMRGDAREEAVREFLRRRLPGAFEICNGEVVDFLDRHSLQLDVMIYDKMRNSPMVQGPPCLLPVEALLAAIEVKSVLSHEEMVKAYRTAASIYKLRPFHRRFTPTREEGRAAAQSESRCFVAVFAY